MDTSKLRAMVRDKKAALKPKDKTIKPQPGSNRYVLLPGWRKDEDHVWFHEFGQHYIKNAAGEIQAVYPCNDAIYGKSCDICEGLARATRSAADDETIELLKQAKSGRSYLMNVLALDSEDPNTPQILEIRGQAFSQLIDVIDENAEKVFDSENALVFTIKREGKGLQTKYFVQPTLKTHTVPKSAYMKLHNLDDYVKMESEEQQRKALAAINSVAGLLPASTADVPKTSRLGMSDTVEHEAPVTRKVSKPSAALDEELDNLLEDLN